MSGWGNSNSFESFGQWGNSENQQYNSWNSYSKNQPKITELSNVKYSRYTDPNNGGTVVRTNPSKQPYCVERNYKTNITKRVQK